MKKQIYLDYASTTPVDKRVLSVMEPYFLHKYGNPSSLHFLGREANEAVRNARKSISRILNCKPEEIIFTSGGTESDNLAILGLARKLAESGKTGIIACSDIEHHAVLDCVKAAAELGIGPTLIEVDRCGVVKLDKIEALLRSGNVRLISIMYANNEIGTIQPIKGVSALCKKYKALLHVDACQASPYLELDVKRLGIDMLTLNGSKMYGPKGVGLLYVRKGILLSPVAYGGGQEQGLRSGTENVPGIVGLAEALKLSQTERKRESKREMTLRESLIEELTSIKDVILNGDAKLRLPNNACLSFLGIEGESLMLELDKAGVCVSTGSACSSRSLEPSHVIMAIHKHDKLPQKYAHSSIRFTIGRFTTKEEIEYAVSATKDAVNKLRGLSSIW